jgi:peptidyl-prolyl cis-trans isomerase A (cyclophilin A)
MTETNSASFNLYSLNIFLIYSRSFYGAIIANGKPNLMLKHALSNNQLVTLLYQLKSTLVPLVILFTSLEATANSFVRVQTDLGDFTIELFEDDAPITARNFLNYVRSDSFQSTIIHRAEPGFVIQTGKISSNESTNVIEPILKGSPISLEYKLPNVLGSVGMARAASPDSATSEWFVNLADNTTILGESNDGGYAVFGRIIGDGMTVIRKIENLNRDKYIAEEPFDVPVINYSGSGLKVANFVNLKVSEIIAPNYFDNADSSLNIKVDAGSAGYAKLTFSISQSTPNIIVKLEKVEEMPESTPKIAVFTESSGQMILPELVIDGVIVGRELVFSLIDADQFLFQLISVN